MKKDFYEGYTFALTGRPDDAYKIISSSEGGSSLELDRELTSISSNKFPAIISSPEEAPVFASRLITKTALNENFPDIQMRLATTKGTNSLLEREGGKTLFLITEGFADLLRIRNQQRPDLFTLNIRKPQPFFHSLLEVPARMDSEGTIIRPLDTALLRKRLQPHLEGVNAAAVCLMHGYRNPDHERQVRQLLTELGIERISLSSDLSSAIKIVPRAISSDINAFLAPVMELYLENISQTVGGTSLRVMTSAGTLAASETYKPVDGLLSGPAGGVTGAAAIGKRNGFHKIITFDMGGTSTDVSRYDSGIDQVYEHRVGDAELVSPAVDIETVAAGGGSVCGFDGISLTVGPGSAGADPGPACYGLGGPLTLTDVNLLSGRLHPDNFRISIQIEAAESALEKVLNQVNASRETALERKDLLSGYLEIANERMAQAIRSISIQKGFNPSEYAMVAFGGAGAQHALSVADKLDMLSVLIPSDAGLLSAYGLKRALREEIALSQVLMNLNEFACEIEERFNQLEKSAQSRLTNQGVDPNYMETVHRLIFLRFSGQDTSLEIEWSPSDDAVSISKKFSASYKDQYGHMPAGRVIEVEAVRVIVRELDMESESVSDETASHGMDTSAPLETADMNSETDVACKVYHNRDLKPGDKILGPSMVLDPFSTLLIDKGWRARMLQDRTWHIVKQNTAQNVHDKSSGRSREVNLQLYINRFRSAADQMGEMLRKTALSVNVKERLDYSCALLDRNGYLVVNAPHIPVHLGAMGTCVRSLIQQIENGSESFINGSGEETDFEEGDVIITNHPGYGGSHLPDVTIVTPVFFKGEKIGYVASRAHHSEIGGKRPGSMPPDARNLEEEGVVIPPAFLARRGKFFWNEIRHMLENSPWPSRAVNENIADMEAAVAANHRGVAELNKLAGTYGSTELVQYMEEIRHYASRRMKRALSKLGTGSYSASERLDDGSKLEVLCELTKNGLRVDFSGTSPVTDGNLNANPSIVNSVLMYVLRLIIDEPLPLNDGILDPVEVILPECMLNPDFSGSAAECPAVVGGNTETSQRLTDTLLKAFGLSACSYGTMNNVLFGDDTFGYYETVAGGTGAGDGFHGADAVHQHMTNTRAADPEVLEYRYPVRLERYEVRRGSGGIGAWNGGNGITREMTFLKPVSLSVLTQHRIIEPYGLMGGGTGSSGVQYVVRKGKDNEDKLSWRDGAELNTGDRFILKTPGGGGYGKKDS
ncbi:hydantoinase B/oxoprolinase family protein [Rhodohalobacter mucosus]|uniref:hydantoinase B/oxoprolinase family protein n=1 Tax=Rhodohalobacter mucosus TaxID=2079485 RepID=UPI001FA89920|nr:hydantoinase B/oxoprolinase family protein [Rhodohalobacter mucosus]